jgi:cytochrome c oxidase subunit 3
VTTSLVFLGIIMATIVGWLLRQSIGTRPWEATAAGEEVNHSVLMKSASAPFALCAFMAVATSFFALFISAYAMRMHLPDWRPLAEPGLLYANTAVLLGSSVVLQWASFAANRGRPGQVRLALSAAIVTALLFLAGQFAAWRQLIDAGLYLQTNPSYAFFYLFTALHGLHLAGGLWVLAGTTVKVLRGGFDPAAVRRSIGLCAIYWHFLFVVWLALYWLMLST